MRIHQFLSAELETTKEEINRFALLAPNKYKVYSIPKRTSGSRIIAHPSKLLKIYQRKTIQLLTDVLPVHQAACAYKKGTGIKHNAMKHRKSKYLLKMDFQNFFHSITPALLFKIVSKTNVKLTKEDKNLLTKLLFWSPSKRTGGKLILSVGAPSSPFVSNTIMFFFDESLSKICSGIGVTYTRYADDITFSTNNKNVLFDIPPIVKELLAEEFDGFISVNESKTVYSSKAHNRHVTGVTIANDNSLSIGRARKRYISSLIHKFKIGELPSEDVGYLQGLIAFSKDIEPEFEHRMIKKYSLDTLKNIERYTRTEHE